MTAAMDRLRAGWRTVALVILFALLPAIVLGRVPLFGGVDAGFRSLSRNFVIVVLLGVAFGARHLRLPPSNLIAPLLTFLAATALSTGWNGGHFGEVRLLGLTIGVFLACRVLADFGHGAKVLFHWLGLYALGTVAAELLARPDLLRFQPWMRDQLVHIHPNTLGGVLAILLPLFVATMLRSSHRIAAGVYAIAALIGVGISFSRAAWIGTAVGAALLTAARRRERIRVGALAAPLGGLLATGVVAGLLSIGRSGADWQRLRIVRTSLSLFLEHWVLGIGYGIANLSEQFRPRYVERYGQNLFLFHSHNLYVDVLVGTGVLGAAAALWLLWRVISTALATRAGADTVEEWTEAAGYVTSIAVILLLGLTDSLFYHAQVMVVLGVLWALMETRAQQMSAGAARLPAREDPPPPMALTEEIAAAR